MRLTDMEIEMAVYQQRRFLSADNMSFMFNKMDEVSQRGTMLPCYQDSDGNTVFL